MVLISREILEKSDCPICGKEKGFIGLAGQFICSKCFMNWKNKTDEALINSIKEANITVQE